MIDEATIRKQLAEFRGRLDQLDAERQAIQGIVAGYETLLGTMGKPEASRQPKSATARPGSSQPVGAVSMRSAVARVLRSAERPMHTKDVLQEAVRIGAATTSKDPASVVDLVLLSLSKKGQVEKVGPRTYRWIAG